jgi:uncharacterized linocin/CFP29 family protein
MGESNRAAVDSGRQFWAGGSGKWAGERLLAAVTKGETFGPSALRTLDTLRSEEWKAFDSEIITGAQTKLRLVKELIAAGLTIALPNAMAKTVLEYDLVGDMDPATVSMDGMARSENDTLEWEMAGLPIPIVHKDFFINIRKLMSSRLTGQPLDTLQSNISGRKVGEEIERMTIQGGKSFQSLPIYGLLTHPKRNTSGFGTGGNWAQVAKTGDNILADVLTGMSALQADGFDGPYWVYYSTDAQLHLLQDYKTTSDKTIRDRVLDLKEIQKFEPLPQLPAGNVVMFQATKDVIAIVNGEDVQTVQWDVNGGFGVNFKAFAIQIPLVRCDADENSGVFHMS